MKISGVRWIAAGLIMLGSLSFAAAEENPPDGLYKEDVLIIEEAEEAGDDAPAAQDENISDDSSVTPETTPAEDPEEPVPAGGSAAPADDSEEPAEVSGEMVTTEFFADIPADMSGLSDEDRALVNECFARNRLENLLVRHDGVFIVSTMHKDSGKYYLTTYAADQGRYFTQFDSDWNLIRIDKDEAGNVHIGGYDKDQDLRYRLVFPEKESAEEQRDTCFEMYYPVEGQKVLSVEKTEDSAEGAADGRIVITLSASGKTAGMLSGEAFSSQISEGSVWLEEHVFERNSLKRLRTECYIVQGTDAQDGSGSGNVRADEDRIKAEDIVYEILDIVNVYETEPEDRKRLPADDIPEKVDASAAEWAHGIIEDILASDRELTWVLTDEEGVRTEVTETAGAGVRFVPVLNERFRCVCLDEEMTEEAVSADGTDGLEKSVKIYSRAGLQKADDEKPETAEDDAGSDEPAATAGEDTDSEEQHL